MPGRRNDTKEMEERWYCGTLARWDGEGLGPATETME